MTSSELGAWDKAQAYTAAQGYVDTGTEGDRDTGTQGHRDYEAKRGKMQ